MPQHPFNKNLLFKRLTDAIYRIFDANERSETAHRELDLILQAVEPIRKKKPGLSPPNVSREVATVVGPKLFKALRSGDLLKLSLRELRKLKPSQAITSKMLQAAQEWKGINLTDVVIEVQSLIAKQLCDLEEQLEKLHPVDDISRIGEIKKEIMRLKVPSEVRLMKYVRDEILVLTIALEWEEMPSCLVDRRQTWLGSGDRRASFYGLRNTLMDSLDAYPEAEMRDRYEWLKFLCYLKSYASKMDNLTCLDVPWYYSIPRSSVQNSVPGS